MNQGLGHNPFEQFLTDTVTLRKADGSVHADIKASVQSRKIFIPDVSLRIEPEDRFTRTLPSGQVEEYIVEEANYSEAFHGIPAQWTVICRRGNQRPQDTRSITYNLSGPNSRINVQSYDHSTNIVQQDPPAVFSEMRAVLAQLVSEVERARILERIQGLEQAHGTPGFTARYQEFIAAAANHMALFAPFLPALSSLLRS
jgi:hypothetical protein